VIAGYGVAVATQILIFPHATLPQNLRMGAVCTVSIARAFALPRTFEEVRLFQM